MKIIHIPLADIKVDRENRQRRSLSSIPSLAESIKRYGLLHPIIVTDDLTLIAGERRLEAFRFLSRDTIPAQLFSDLTETQRSLVELEENIRRVDLHWWEHTSAVGKYIEMSRKENPDASLESIGNNIGLGASSISGHNRVYEAGKKDPALTKLESYVTALNVVERRTERANEAILSNVNFTTNKILEENEIHVEEPAPAPAPFNIYQSNFLELLPNYSGPRYNFLHCDFPYGVNIDRSGQNESNRFTTYNDTPDLYFSLCNCLITHLDKIVLPSAHIFFWFSMSYYQETIELFSRNTDLVINPFPCVWLKSDNKGILPDPSRGPRRVYETALIMTRGDRKIVNAVGNAHSAPTTASDRLHLSEKPVPVLKHFFRMFVDEFTTIYDPTCGSGNALVAAEDLGATVLAGTDINQEFVDLSTDNLTRHLKLKEANKRLASGG